MGFQCLEHSNWTICTPLGPFCWNKFSTFSLSYWGANSYYPRGPIMGKGNSHNPRKEWDSGFSVLSAFKLDHLQPFKPILSRYFYTFFTFILGSPFLLPQRTNYQKGEFCKLQIWMKQRNFSACSIQTGPLAVFWVYFVQIFSHLFHFHTGEPILITPEGQLSERGTLPPTKLDDA